MERILGREVQAWCCSPEFADSCGAVKQFANVAQWERLSRRYHGFKSRRGRQLESRICIDVRQIFGGAKSLILVSFLHPALERLHSSWVNWQKPRQSFSPCGALSRNLTLPGGETRSLRVLFGGFWARLRSMECVGV